MAEPIQNSQTGAESNFGECELGDQRRTPRAVRIAGRMADHPGGSSPRQMSDWSELKACYRFFNMRSVTFEALARPHWEQTCAAARGRVLIINDTTEISFGPTRKVRGLGPVGKGSTRGFYLHNALMADARTGAVLGLARQELFHRTPAPVKENRRQRGRRRASPKFGDGSSMRWDTLLLARSTCLCVIVVPTIWRCFAICASNTATGSFAAAI